MSRNAPILSIQSIDSVDLARIMQAALVDSTISSAIIHACRLLDHRQRDGQRGATQFEIESSATAEGDRSQKLVSALALGGHRTRRLWRQIEEMEFPEVVSGSGLRPFAYVPDLDILLQVFPFDARLEALQHLAPTVSPKFATVLNEDSPSTSKHDGAWRGRSVRYRPDMRATVELEFVPDDPAARARALRYFAKVYRDPEQAQRAFLMQMSLWEAISHTGQSFQVARPLPVPPQHNMLLTSAVAGVPLARTMKRGGNQDGHIQAAARAVAGLHRLQVSAPPRPATMEVNQARDSGEKLLAVYPGLEARVNGILEAVTSGLQHVPMSFVHGDLKPDHILVDGEDFRVSIIDFDLAATADPMLDVAHFMAFLARSSSRSRGSEGEPADPNQLFLDEYFTHVSHDGLARLPLYHAIAALHKATGLIRQSGSDSLGQATAVLDEGLRFIAGETAGSIAPSFKRRMTRTT